MAPTAGGQVSVVIPTFNRRSLLPAVLEPLLADPATAEVVVVVDGAHDGSMELLRASARGDSRLVPIFQANQGAAAARATGVERSTSDLVLLLDDDIVPGPGLVSGHARRHAAGRGLVVVGYVPVASVADVATRMYAATYEAACRRWDEAPAAILEALWIGNISLRREDALRVGLEAGDHRLDYHEDMDFGLRCRDAGLCAVFDRSLRGSHRYERTIAGVRADARNQGRAMAALRTAFPQDVAPERSSAFSTFCATPAAPVVASALALGTRLCGAARLPRAEERAVETLIRVERRRAAVRASRTGASGA